MANTNAGESLQKAIAEGRATQCSAICKASGERCKRVAVDGYEVCQVHGAGSPVRVEKGLRKAPGRPIEHGIYSHHLNDDEVDVYEESFGDLTLIHEAALAKVKLASYLKRMADMMIEQSKECEVDVEDGQIDIVGITKKQKKDSQKDPDLLFMKMLDSTVKTVTAAYDQLREKKIVVNIKGSDEEVLKKVQDMAAKELDFIAGLLCSDCKAKLLEALKARQVTRLE
jgi:hypothetical protein